MGWLRDKVEHVKGIADTNIMRATPKGLRGPMQGLVNTTNQLQGFALDPLYGSRTRAQEAESAEMDTSRIDERIENLPEYQISDEATQRMELLQQTGAEMVSGAEEATGLAKMRAGMVEAPGASQAQRDIEGASSRQVQAIQQMGGAGALGAAAQVGLGEEAAYEDLIRSNMQYKEKSESALMGALQTEAGIRTQAAGLEGQALEGMISEKDKVYQSQMNIAQTGIQFDVSKLAMEEQRRSAEVNKPKILGLF